MDLKDVTDKDRAEIRNILTQWRDGGNSNPLLPMEVDVDGDGMPDSWGLDENGEVIIVSSTPLHFTVYRSDGDDVIEHGAQTDG